MNEELTRISDVTLQVGSSCIGRCHKEGSTADAALFVEETILVVFFGQPIKPCEELFGVGLPFIGNKKAVLFTCIFPFCLTIAASNTVKNKATLLKVCSKQLVAGLILLKRITAPKGCQDHTRMFLEGTLSPFEGQSIIFGRGCCSNSYLTLL